jgi:hypothetical protein
LKTSKIFPFKEIKQGEKATARRKQPTKIIDFLLDVLRAVW